MPERQAATEPAGSQTLTGLDSFPTFKADGDQEPECPAAQASNQAQLLRYCLQSLLGFGLGLQVLRRLG